MYLTTAEWFDLYSGTYNDPKRGSAMNWLLIAQLIQQLLPVAVQAIDAVEKATGKTPEEAAKEVIDHLTPGAPNSPALNATKPG